jgi:hypothetical protein
MKIRPLGAELFRVDRRMDRHDELIVDFCNFVNAPKQCLKYTVHAWQLVGSL